MSVERIIGEFMGSKNVLNSDEFAQVFGEAVTGEIFTVTKLHLTAHCYGIREIKYYNTTIQCTHDLLLGFLFVGFLPDLMQAILFLRSILFHATAMHKLMYSVIQSILNMIIS